MLSPRKISIAFIKISESDWRTIEKIVKLLNSLFFKRALVKAQINISIDEEKYETSKAEEIYKNLSDALDEKKGKGDL